MKNLIKKIIPLKFINFIRSILSKVDIFLVPFFIKSSILASVYYLFFNQQFYRENLSVLAGRYSYYKSLTDVGKSSALLRRNIHRIEKGLIMQPRRDSFAEAFIQETVQVFSIALKQGVIDSEEKKWIGDVLFEYFRAVKLTPKIERAKNTFDELDVTNSTEYIPYAFSDLPKLNFTYEDLKDLFTKRRSVRWYEDKMPPLDLIEKAINIATLAPSACNRQPYKFYVSENKQRAYDIARLAGGTPGWLDNIPCVIVVVGDLSAYPSERDRHVIYIDASLASMQLMLAFETLGLSSCSINWPDINNSESQMKKLLNLELYERPIMLISVGYAKQDGGIPFSQKKTSKNLMIRV